jgi:hypothetical protein
MEEEFYSTIKLVTGEELVSKVCYVNDEDCLFLDHPMKVETVKQKKSGQTIEGFILTEWIHATYDKSFILPMKNVVTMTELDKRIERYYLSFIEGEDQSTGRVPVKDMKGRMGYLGSIQETKKILEEIYKKS